MGIAQAGVTGNPIWAYTDLGRSDLLVESICRIGSGPRISITTEIFVDQECYGSTIRDSSPAIYAGRF